MIPRCLVPEEVIVKKSLILTSPNGGETWIVGKTYNITWQSSGIDKVNIYFIDDAAGFQCAPCIPEICCPPCGQIITKGISATLGKYSWEIPTTQTTTSEARIAVQEAITDESCLADYSDNYFSIVPTVKSITVISPNGGEMLETGKTYEIKWNSTGIESVRIDLLNYNTITGFPEIETIATSLATLGKYSWTIPKDIVSGERYKIRIAEVDKTRPGIPESPPITRIFDLSDNYFSIKSS